ncbi:microcin-processing peptidase 1. Unknown type peptidase. MEROPS family U62 [Candidatus Kryptonium thompsonii]|uniref:PmbA protein n=3 Tax=Candidatus Kryptonium thompsonii TaxID=1633631 RepID=A0A0P1LX04_9BACT|nr:TldD/PmbA family protein [Candidatus Kryptonium thompsoni]CUS78924.1 microcin-processing peptidase 1. Unknown type peptidase. MEROPS family U62 [Candidatus Kryptonium thompsoni]CUS83401.1 microcin-processing peptidase 1. Unknown type peptidase. MEROPS family U62 [Candidatus Kryptonium thompsoni]CUS84708.1 microcin-processing peptidase 1. Unknown type peptidase. MEROPS family U62 [Candidatus Kryptonium thompsoni]CUS86472.1 microcin-processing peptidase 1. Unknown type peptidase. MEROPS family
MNTIELAKSVVLKTLQKGAEECDVFISIDDEFSAMIKDAEIESIKQAVTHGLGIRVFKNKKIGFSYTTDFSNFAIEKAIEEAITLAENSTPEPDNELPKIENQNEIKIFDPNVFSINVDEKIKIAKEIESFAKSYDPRIKVESTGFGNVIQRRTLASSNGFIGEYEGTIFEIYCSTIASEDGESQTGFYSSVSRFFDKLQTPEFVAKNASIRALQLLHPQKIKTGRYPVIFDPITSATLVSYISSAVNGKNTYRKMSFLFDKIGEKIANESLTVIDNGRFEDGIASKPFDDEGIETRENLIIENGVLKMFLLDSITAKKFALPPTGNAHRKYNTIPAPAPTNFYIKPGNKSPEEIINEINEGLLITKLIGFGVDIVSGNFSKGASGLWIKNGEIAFAVDKITIADNLSDILRNITLVGNDIIFFSNIASPTILVSEMTVTCD